MLFSDFLGFLEHVAKLNYSNQDIPEHELKKMRLVPPHTAPLRIFPDGGALRGSDALMKSMNRSKEKKVL
jgi:hypothetical protein